MLNLRSNILENNYSSQTKHYFLRKEYASTYCKNKQLCRNILIACNHTYPRFTY